MSNLVKIGRLCRQYGLVGGMVANFPGRVDLWGGRLKTRHVGYVQVDWDWEEIEMGVVESAMRDAFDP